MIYIILPKILFNEQVAIIYDLYHCMHQADKIYCRQGKDLRLINWRTPCFYRY